MKNPLHEAVLFDLGAVVVDWNPRYLFRSHFDGDEAAMENFLAEVCTTEWIREMDAGKPVRQAIAERSRTFPGFSRLIAMWYSDWETMLRGPIEETVAILDELRRRGTRLYALTNWSAENFPIARRRFDFLSWFEEIIVSGEVGLLKPDPRIFRVAFERCRLHPARTVFVDDVAENVAGGRAAGLHALHFTGATKLRSDLQELALL